MTRTVEVEYARLRRWLVGFADRHGAAAVDGGRIVGADGVTAVVRSWSPIAGATSIDDLVSASAPPQRLGLVLVRRGGYAVAVVDDGDVVTRKVGRRHVQSRTAAGGWSQQRFARRRGKQADELVAAVIEHTVGHVVGSRLDGLVRGGDRTLVAAVLDDPRLRGLADLPTRDLYDLPDPTPSVLDRAIVRALSVTIDLSD